MQLLDYVFNEILGQKKHGSVELELKAVQAMAPLA